MKTRVKAKVRENLKTVKVKAMVLGTILAMMIRIKKAMAKAKAKVKTTR